MVEKLEITDTKNMALFKRNYKENLNKIEFFEKNRKNQKFVKKA